MYRPYTSAVTCLPIVVFLLSSCASHTIQRNKATGTIDESFAAGERPQSMSGWSKTRTPLGLSGEVILFDGKDRAVIAGIGEKGRTMIVGRMASLLSRNDRESWRALENGKGGYGYTIDGGITYRTEQNPTSPISTSELCSVDSAVASHSGRIYLKTLCEEHGTIQVWAVPIENASPAWHGVSFASDQNDSNGASYAPVTDFAASGERVFIGATRPDGPSLLTTDDDGATWRPSWQALPGDAGIVSVNFINGYEGWLIQGDGKLSKTSDGGRTWQQVSTLASEIATSISSLNFADSRVGFIVGTNGLILATDNGGYSWHQQTSGIQSDLTKVVTASNQRAWAVGHRGIVLETIDGGSHWQRIPVDITADLNWIVVKNGIAWIVSENWVYYSASD